MGVTETWLAPPKASLDVNHQREEELWQKHNTLCKTEGSLSQGSEDMGITEIPGYSI